MNKNQFVNSFIDARLNANHTQLEASIIIKCGLSTVSQLETAEKIPTSKAILSNIENYIKRNTPKKETSHD